MKYRALIITATAFLITASFIFAFHKQIVFYVFNRAMDRKITTNEEYDQRICQNCLELIRMNPYGYAPMLLKELSDADRIRSDTASYILRLVNVNLNQPLCKIIRETTYPHVRKNALALIEPESSNYEMISAIFRDPKEDDETKYICGNLLVRVSDQDLIQQNIALLHDKDPKVRERAVYAFIDDKKGKYIGAIRKMTEDSDKEVKIAAILSMLDVKGEFAPKSLIILYKHDVIFACRALEHIAAKRDKNAIPYLKEFIKIAKDKDVKEEAEKTLRGFLNVQP